MSVDKLTSIQNEIQLKIKDFNILDLKPTIVAVSKTYPLSNILPLIKYGHMHYGENKVQEAINKWTEIKVKNKKIILHLIGRLQTNKVKSAIKIFDYIHSLDNEKLAKKIAEEQIKQKKTLRFLFRSILVMKIKKQGYTKKISIIFINFAKIYNSI